MSTLTQEKCPIVQAPTVTLPGARSAVDVDQQLYGNSFVQESLVSASEGSWLEGWAEGFSDDSQLDGWEDQESGDPGLEALPEFECEQEGDQPSRTAWKNPNWPSIWDYGAAMGVVPQEFADDPASVSLATWPGKVDALLAPLTAAASLTSCDDPEWWTKTATIGMGVAEVPAGLPRPSLARGVANEVVEEAPGAVAKQVPEAVQGEELFALGKPVAPMERTMEHALEPSTQIRDVVARHGINLRGSGQSIEVIIDTDLGPGQLGVTRAAEGGQIIRIGRDALADEATLANTVAHELSHARDYLRGVHKPHGDASSLGDGSVYGAGNALEDHIRGRR